MCDLWYYMDVSGMYGPMLIDTTLGVVGHDICHCWHPNIYVFPFPPILLSLPHLSRMRLYQTTDWSLAPSRSSLTDCAARLVHWSLIKLEEGTEITGDTNYQELHLTGSGAWHLNISPLYIYIISDQNLFHMTVAASHWKWTIVKTWESLK